MWRQNSNFSDIILVDPKIQGMTSKVAKWRRDEIKVNIQVGVKKAWSQSIRLSHSLTILMTAGTEIERKINLVTVKDNVQKAEGNKSATAR